MHEDYDAITHITAGQLREKGFPVAARIPDRAWIRRADVKMKTQRANSDDGEPLYRLDTWYEGPFRWVEDDTLRNEESS
jgi:hypothetical protein